MSTCNRLDFANTRISTNYAQKSHQSLIVSTRYLPCDYRFRKSSEKKHNLSHMGMSHRGQSCKVAYKLVSKFSRKSTHKFHLRE